MPEVILSRSAADQFGFAPCIGKTGRKSGGAMFIELELDLDSINDSHGAMTICRNKTRRLRKQDGIGLPAVAFGKFLNFRNDRRQFIID
jgi:hypothetical protein